MAEGPDYRMLLHPELQTRGDSLLDMASKAQDIQAQRAQMQQVAYQQQRQRSLQDLVSQNADAYGDPAARAYALGGFGEQAQQAQAAAIQRQQMAYQQQQKQIELQESAAKLEGIHRDLTASRLAGAKTQEDFDKIATAAPEEYGLKPGDENWQDAVKTFRKSLITPEQEAENNKTRYKEGKFGGLFDSHTGQWVSPEGTMPGKGGGAPGSLPQAALDVMVDKAVVDGEMPKFGSGALGMKQRYDFLNRFQEKYPGQNMATAHALYHANLHNLTGATEQGAVQDVKEGKALGDIAILKGAMSKIWGSSIPAINALGRTVEEARGDPNYRAYTTALAATLPSVNAVLNSNQMSVGAREEVKELLKEKDSPASMMAALNIMEQDMARSTEATHKRVSNARATFTTPPARGAKPAAAPANSSPHTPEEINAARAWLADPKNGTPSQRKSVQAILDGG